MDLWSLGKEPIRPDQPAGVDVRYDPDFEALQAEIDKLSTPSATGGTDWGKVERLAAAILSGKSKDLLAASYFAVAAIRIRGLEGLAQGLQIMADLTEHFWEDLFPPKKRMRGRAAAIEWWVEKSAAALEDIKPEGAEEEAVQRCREALMRVDAFLQANLDSPPLTRPLERFIDAIPVQGGDAAETGAAPASSPAQSTGSAAAGAPGEFAARKDNLPGAAAESAAPPVESSPSGPPASAASPEPQRQPASKPTAGPAGARPEPVETGQGVQPASAVEAERLLRGALQAIRRAADYYLGQDLGDPRSYRLRRIASWSLIHALPPAVNGRTEVPPPMNMPLLESELKDLKAKGNWEVLIRSAEERFQSAVLWLDLSRFAAEALTRMGPRYLPAQDAILHETMCLVERLPGIEGLSFSDGTPCADGATRSWLESHRPLTGAEPAGAAQAAGAGAARGPDAALLEQAREMAGRKRLADAAGLLQQGLRGGVSRREQMGWRLSLCEVLLGASETQAALPQLEAVLQDVETFRLEIWDPDLAVQALRLVWRGLSAASAGEAQNRAAAILDRIARLAPADALRLAGR